MNEAVDWDFALKIATKIAKKEDFEKSYLADSVDEDFAQATPQAEALVRKETGLITPSVAKAKVIDRISWVEANISSFNRLLKPFFNKMEDHEDAPDFSDSKLGRRLGARATRLNPFVDTARSKFHTSGKKLAGAEVGALLGWMSGRVLGQYDLLITEDDAPQDQDWVYYVGPNIVSLEKRYGFPPKEFRLWIAVHECTHRAQFMGVPWLRDYFLSLVNSLLDDVNPDSQQLISSIKNAIANKRNKGDDSQPQSAGIASLFASEDQKKTMDKVAGLMSLLEGHGDIVMDRATKDIIPSQPRFSRIMSTRRTEASGFNKLFQKATGMQAKLAQYEEGEAFIHSVEATGGKELFDQVWTGPEALPTLEEIRTPQLWIDRISA